MAHAYTPGLRIAGHTRLRKERRLPLTGEVLVAVGDRVRRDQVVARTQLPGDVATVNLVNRLGVSAGDLPRYLLKAVGDAVVAGEPLAATRPWIQWFKTVVPSPIDGTVESVSAVTGQMMLRTPAAPVEVCAYVDGTVVEVLPGQGVVVETEGAFVQGIFGVGGESYGRLRILADGIGQDLTPAQIDADCAGCILVATGLVSHAAIARARQVGAAGVIGGGIHDGDLRQLLGHDLGVAITGAEDLGLTVIVTEGFGQIAMAARTFAVLRACAGREASISGATQIRAGVLRPEIIVPAAGGTRGGDEGVRHAAGLQLGDALRVIRAPWFGRIGVVAELISGLQQVESGARVRVLAVTFDDGTRAVVPRANVERIEE